MGKRLIVAEKPSVGRDIANVLNCRENGDGCRIGEHDVVTWAVGHLIGLCYPDEMDEKYAEWKIEDLPIVPAPFRMKVLESGKQQFDIVKSWMNDPEIDSIVCATDAGREGELIFRYIYQMADCSKPVQRLWISSLTYRAIKEGFENLKPASDYDRLYESAKCRSEADWLVGMNGSRAYAIENNMRRLSIGRVLSPTLSILVQRELERRGFVPEEYCEIVASFGTFEGRMLNMQGKEYNTHFPADQKEVLNDFIKAHTNFGRIIFAENTKETQPAQLLYDLTSLQRDANRIYGMSSKWTLDTAQSLYERHKAITYPRTDSRYLTADIKSTFQQRLESLLTFGGLKDAAVQAISSEKDLFGRFINNKGVSDHHAIIPTGEAKNIEKWTKQEKQIYELIARRFISMFLPDRVILRQELRTEVDGRTFCSTGEKVITDGWGFADLSRKDLKQVLPELSVGDQVEVSSMRLRMDKTKPPAPHTEASLLTAMEHAGTICIEDVKDDVETEFGIGTPATRAATIEKMIEREMAVRKGRTLIPTEYGMKLISILPEALRSPEMTGRWEARLARINNGKESADSFMKDIRGFTEDLIAFAVQQGDTGVNEASSVGMCPVCGNRVKEYENAYYCVNKDCTFRKIYKAVKGVHPTLASLTMRELLANGTAETEKGKYTLISEQPYIAFEYAPKIQPDYEALKRLIEEYGFEVVDKTPSGGGLWIAGDKHDEIILDFVNDCKAAHCDFAFVEDSKALKHRSGWCHRVDLTDMKTYEKEFQYHAAVTDASMEEKTSERKKDSNSTDDVITMLEEAGFEYVDKRANGGSLWIIAGENEGKKITEKCKTMGMRFAFTQKGGKASKHRPAWYSLS